MNQEPVQLKQEPIHAAPISSYEGGQSASYGGYIHENGSAQHDQYNEQDEQDDDGYGPVGIKEDG